MQYKIGEVVMLKSGTYLMSVASIDDDVVHCQWLNYRDEKFEEEFSSELLFSPVKTKLFLDYDKPADTFFPSYECPSRNIGYYAILFSRLDIENNDIKIGSIVRFSSYYAFMTVESIRDENNVVCIWFNKFGYLKREVFDINTLNVYDSNNKKSYQSICIEEYISADEYLTPVTIVT